MVRKARVEQVMNRDMRTAARRLGTSLVSWGKKLKKFGTFAKQPPTPKTTTRVQVRTLSKLSPHH